MSHLQHTVHLFRGRIHSEAEHPVSRRLIRLYEPALTWALRRKWIIVSAAVAMMIGTVSSAFAASGAREDNSGIFAGIFLAFCALIVVAQMLPAVLMMLGFGIGFEFPVFLVALELVGVLTPQQLANARRFAIVGIVVVVAVATPSGDPYSLLALSIPLIIFYEVSIVIGKLVLRHRTRSAPAPA